VLQQAETRLQQEQSALKEAQAAFECECSAQEEAQGQLQRELAALQGASHPQAPGRGDYAAHY
jgi:hypothetical protein